MPVPNIANPNDESIDSLLSQLIGFSDGTPDHFSCDNIFEFVLLNKLKNGHQVLGDLVTVSIGSMGVYQRRYPMLSEVNLFI